MLPLHILPSETQTSRRITQLVTLYWVHSHVHFSDGCRLYVDVRCSFFYIGVCSLK